MALALLTEDLGDCLPFPALDLVVEVEEGPRKTLRHSAADSRFASTRESNQYQVWPTRISCGYGIGGTKGSRHNCASSPPGSRHRTSRGRLGRALEPPSPPRSHPLQV